jgi:hypothetical protein
MESGGVKRKVVVITSGLARLTVGVLMVALLTVQAHASAFDDGGGSIGEAPGLPLGERIVISTNKPLFWRVQMDLADQIVIDFGSTNKEYAEVCLLRPDVNDYSINDAPPCAFFVSTKTKSQLRFIAPASGGWIIVVWGCKGCQAFRPTDWRVAYELTAFVKRFTRVTLLAPTRASVGRRVKLKGTVEGATTGVVDLVARVSGQWVPLGRSRLQAGGFFVFNPRLSQRGLFRVRALYPGDSSHRASGTTVTLRVV